MSTTYTTAGPALRFGAAAARARQRVAHERKLTIKSTSRSRARLSLTMLAYCAAAIGALIFAPFQFSVPGTFHVTFRCSVEDVVTATLLFVPLGFLFPLTRRADNTSATRIFAFAAVAASVVELVHLFQGEHVAVLPRIVAGAAGAAVGAVLLDLVNRRIRLNTRLAGRLSLEIPLMGLAYLLVPLLIVAAMVAVNDTQRMLLMLPLGLFGARLLAAVQEYHFAPAGVFRHRTMAGISAGWMALATFPVWLHYPVIGAGLAASVGISTWYYASHPALHGLERRFEVDVLRNAAPYLATYFFGMAVLPLASGIGDWSFSMGLIGAGDDPAAQLLLLVEPVAAFVIVGYALAELRGRRELQFGAIAPRLLLECAALAIVVEATRGFQSDVGASGAQLILMLGAGLLGARIYHDQRERVRWIIIRRKVAPVVTATAKIVAA